LHKFDSAVSFKTCCNKNLNEYFRLIFNLLRWTR
jgi:hypothetical protein